jgi:hypothetical protein
MRRILLFNTRRVENPQGPALLWAPLYESRDLLMTEVLTNANTIVSILRHHKALSPENPAGTIASWAEFAQKVTSWFSTRKMLRAVLVKLGEEKQDTVLDEDVLWQLLEYALSDRPEPLTLEPQSTTALYQQLVGLAEEMKIERDFRLRFKSPKALGKHLVNIKDELGRRVVVDQIRGKGWAWNWGFRLRPKTAQTEASEEAAAEYTDTRLPEGISQPGEERPLTKEEANKASREFGMGEWSEDEYKAYIDRQNEGSK